MREITLRNIGLSALLFGALSVSAQGQADLIAKKEKKLQGSWLNKAEWITDYDAARAEAKASGKAIFTYFTRSYAP